MGQIIDKILQDGDILLFKGGKWDKLLKMIYDSETRKWYLARTIIQLITLSRFTHTATAIKQGKDWYIVQSLSNGGVQKQRLYM